MRLTHVAHLRLPFGRLLGYELTAGARRAELPVSFDQRRHVGVGERPGSWMAITIRLSEVDLDRLAAAWVAVVRRHGTLRSVFSPGDDGPELHEVDIGPGQWTEHTIGAGARLSDAVRGVLDSHCTPYSAPSHRLCVVLSDDRPTVIVAADHAHVDMWSLLVVVRDLLEALRLDAGVEPDWVSVPAFAEHTAALRAREGAPDDVLRRWREILAASGDVMPCFPMPLGDLSEPVPERVEVRDVLDVDASASMARWAREHGVSTLAVTVSVMTGVTRDLTSTPLRAVFPVHSRYEQTWHDSVGWFITNSVLESVDPEPGVCAAAVKEAVRLGSSLLPDVFEPWGGMPQAPGMFAISWLDLRRLPVRVDHAGLEAQYVSAAGRTDGVMVWFVLDEAGMHLRCRYPDTGEARTSVRAWLDAVVVGIRAKARLAGSELVVEGRRLVVERATRGDIAAVVALLSADPISAGRETPESVAYEDAFDTIARDPAQFLAVVRAEGEGVVATVQLTVVPGLARRGATRLQVEALRVAEPWRRRGLGTALLEWAHEHGRTRGAALAQVASDAVRRDAHRFYEAAGYEATHVGFKRTL